MRLGSNQLNTGKEKWRSQLDRFVRENEKQLAALAWGLQQEWGDLDNTLGIDLKPKPHFVACSREAIEELNRNTNGQIQEILGLIDGYKLEQEVSIVVIGDGQIKLIHFQPEPSPPACFQEVTEDIDTLISILEERLVQSVSLN
ncbi:hypothetical protein IQ238_19910 [Pleurocapsales cyanobacterium LEGE 06147]|nr:hypothetical protein [Pleurocapsales cyanobacterium LEGE 06147]